VLSNTSLQEWTLNAPRANLIAQNKEGLVSLTGKRFFRLGVRRHSLIPMRLGYLAIHVLGLWTGTILFLPDPYDFHPSVQPRRHDGHDAAAFVNSSKRIVESLGVCFTLWWPIYHLGSLIELGGGVSRRLVCLLLISVAFWKLITPHTGLGQRSIRAMGGGIQRVIHLPLLHF
jgi:glucosaminylphosphatidylinositol acyltransferase